METPETDELSHDIARSVVLNFLPADGRCDALSQKDFTRKQMIDIAHAVAQAIDDSHRGK